ncbi:MAG TPA: energy transducer TonB [Allosphingosinicella sp.]|jgi:protein TonB
MAETGFLEQQRMRPGAAAAVVLLHGAALAALLLAKNPEMVRDAFVRTEVINVDLPPPPPPPPRPQTEPQREQISRWDVPVVDRPIPSPNQVPMEDIPPIPDLGSRASAEEVRGVIDAPQPRVEPRPEPPRPAPVRIAAQLISGGLQPPYPASEQRLEREGRVVIRVTIGADGRVLAAQKVSATSDAFYQATERHARARWRFRPASVDGRPIETSKTLTVVFQLGD